MYRPSVDRIIGRSNSVRGVAIYAGKEEVWDKPDNLNCSKCDKFVRSVGIRRFTVEKFVKTICWECQKHEKNKS